MPSFFVASPLGTSIETGEIADNAVTLAKLAGGTDGNIITYDASGDPAAVSTGSSGQVLTSNGAGAAPTFKAVSGDWVKIHTASANVTADLEVDVNVFTGSAGDFADGDTILIEVDAINDDGTNVAQISIDINDGTNTHSTTERSGINQKCIIYVNISPVDVTNFSKLISNIIQFHQTDINTTVQDGNTSMINNWMAAALTITLRGGRDTASGTTFYRWTIWRLKR